jgi:hypothetical protein
MKGPFFCFRPLLSGVVVSSAMLRFCSVGSADKNGACYRLPPMQALVFLSAEMHRTPTQDAPEIHNPRRGLENKGFNEMKEAR